jgi:hypothetical protein
MAGESGQNEIVRSGFFFEKKEERKNHHLPFFSVYILISSLVHTKIDFHAFWLLARAAIDSGSERESAHKKVKIEIMLLLDVSPRAPSKRV